MRRRTRIICKNTIEFILFFITMMTLISFLCTGCGNKEQSNGFFAWMDGYLAMATGEEYEVALTYFFETDKPPFTADEVQDVSFDNLEKIEVADYVITPMHTDKSLQCGGYVFQLTVRSKETGIYKADKVLLTIGGATTPFSVGEWVFDIEDGISQEDSDKEIDTWSSPVAGSDSRIFSYDYQLANDDVKIKDIWVSDAIVVSDAEGLPLSNEIPLQQTMKAPVNFIRPKIVLEIADEEMTTFGISYYAGALGDQKDLLEKSRKHNMEQGIANAKKEKNPAPAFDISAVLEGIIQEPQTILNDNNEVEQTEGIDKRLRLSIAIDNVTEEKYHNVYYKLKLNDEVKPYIATQTIQYTSEKMDVVSQAAAAKVGTDNGSTKPLVSGFKHEWDLLLTTEEDLKEYHDLSEDGIRTALKSITVQVFWHGGSQEKTIPFSFE